MDCRMSSFVVVVTALHLSNRRRQVTIDGRRTTDGEERKRTHVNLVTVAAARVRAGSTLMWATLREDRMLINGGDEWWIGRKQIRCAAWTASGRRIWVDFH